MAVESQNNWPSMIGEEPQTGDRWIFHIDGIW